jgi:hypothetical protein
MKNKRLILILTSIALLLLIPLFAMQFTTEVNWTLSDFAIMGILLLTTGLSCELVLRIQSKVKFRIVICLAIIAVFFLVWIQISVGII